MNNNTDFNPLEWANPENAPQKSKVNNPTPTAAQGGGVQTDELRQAREVADRIIRAGIDLTDDYGDWFRLGSALASGLGETGRDLFHDLSRMSDKYDTAECDRKYNDCLRNSHSTINLATFYGMAKDAGVDIRPSRTGGDFCATCADAHKHPAKEEKDNKLIINKNEFMNRNEDACASAQSAQTEGEEEIIFTDTFSDRIDREDWCELMRPIIDNTPAPEDTDKMTISTIGMIAGLVPDNIYAVYGQREVYTPIDLAVYGDAASGKGELPHTLGIVKPLKREMEAAYRAKLADYQEEHALWEAKRTKDERMERGPEPQEPEHCNPLIPGNSSATAALLQLKANGGWGLMFETEGDVIANSFKTDYGDYSTLLRKAAHHEPVSISRVRDKLFIEITKPRLGVFITLTPGQLQNLFPSFENGLPTRFIYYGLNRKLEWKDPFKVTGKPLGEVFDEIGEQYLELHHEILKLGERKIQIVLSEEQQRRFNEFFSELLYEQFAMLGEGIESFIFRLGLSALRIMMVLTLLRRYSDWDRSLPLFGEHEQAIVCPDKDFRIAMTIVDTLVNHTAKIFAALNKEEDRNLFKHPVSLSDVQKRLFVALPEEYTSAEVKETAVGLGINPDTARRYMGEFVKQQIARRITNGHYRKINVRR